MTKKQALRAVKVRVRTAKKKIAAAEARANDARLGSPRREMERHLIESEMAQLGILNWAAELINIIDQDNWTNRSLDRFMKGSVDDEN